MNMTGKFKIGLVLGGVTYTHFEMRVPNVGDMIEAESEVGPGTVIAFNSAMAARQLVKVSNERGEQFDGPFTLKMISGLKPSDYRALRDKQLEIDALGEESAGSKKESGTQSS